MPSTHIKAKKQGQYPQLPASKTCQQQLGNRCQGAPNNYTGLGLIKILLCNKVTQELIHASWVITGSLRPTNIDVVYIPAGRLTVWLDGALEKVLTAPEVK